MPAASAFPAKGFEQVQRTQAVGAAGYPDHNRLAVGNQPVRADDLVDQPFAALGNPAHGKGQSIRDKDEVVRTKDKATGIEDKVVRTKDKTRRESGVADRAAGASSTLDVALRTCFVL